MYLPALLDASMGDAALEALATRLGAKAVVDDPILGRAAGMPAIRAHVEKTAKWLADHGASYERLAFTTGIDRDVTEGALSLTIEHKPAVLPVAVVAERRKSREVEVRLYYAAPPVAGESPRRGRLVPLGDDVLLPPPIDDLLAAIAKGDLAAIAQQFEEDGHVRDARGQQHAKKEGGLRTFFERLASGGLALERGGAADDGRTCALECTLVKARGREVPPRSALLLFERGDSGLLRSMRLYDDLET